MKASLLSNCRVSVGLSLLFIASICCGNSCGGNKGEESEQEAIDTISEQMDTIPSQTLSKPMSAVLYFDKSHSMKGYLDAQKDSRFRGTVSSLFTLVKNSQVYMHGVEPDTKALTQYEFLNILNNKKVDYSVESNLFNMIKSMVQSSSDVTFLVTDGIMSGSNKQIRENPSYSINSRDVMTNQIKALVSDFRGQKSALVVRALSRFSGVYYTYNNTKKNLNNIERPFFIICIGNPIYVKYIEQEIKKMEDASKWQIVLLGENYTDMFKLTRKSGLKQVDGQLMFTNKDSCSFSGNITKLPTYMQKKDYLEKCLTFNTKANVVPPSKYTISINKGRAIVTMARLGQLTGGGTLSYKLAFEMPEWISRFSIDDDSNIGGLMAADQTFNLKYFIKGLAELNISEEVANGNFKFRK